MNARRSPRSPGVLRIFFLALLALGAGVPVQGKTLLELGFKNQATGEEPEGWRDQRQNINPAATIACAPGDRGVIEVGNDGGWGSVQHVPFTFNLKQYHMLELDVADMDPDTSLVLDLYREVPSYTLFRCCRVYQADLYVYDLQKILRNENIQSCGIQLTLEGKKGKHASIRRIRIFGMDNTRIIDFPFVEEFKGLAGERPEDWRGGYNNADIICGQSGGAFIKLWKEKFGDVMSPVFMQTPERPFERCLLDIAALSPGAFLDVVLQEENGAARNFKIPGLSNLGKPGKYQADIEPWLRENKIARFSIKIWLNGRPEESQALLKNFQMLQSPDALTESDKNSITLGVESRVYEDFNNYQKVQGVLADLKRKMDAQIIPPLKPPLNIIITDERGLRDAYQRGDLDLIISYQDFYKRRAHAGLLRPVLTVVRQGKQAQVCGLYVKAGGAPANLTTFHAAVLGVTSERARSELEKYFKRANPGRTFVQAFKPPAPRGNIRDLLLELQLGTVDAIAEFEYLEPIAQDLGISLKKIADMPPQENDALYLRPSANPAKNEQMERLLALLEHYHEQTESKPFFEFFKIERFQRLQ